MVLCGLGMQQCAMHNATIQNITFSELGVNNVFSEARLQQALAPSRWVAQQNI